MAACGSDPRTEERARLGWRGSTHTSEVHGENALPAAGAGRRVLLAQATFSNLIGGRFEHPSRSNPIYFEFPSETVDSVTLDLPLMLQVGTIPAPQRRETDILKYEIGCEKQDAGLQCKRHVRLGGF